MLFDYKELRMFLSPSPNLLSNIGGVFSGERFRPHFNFPTWGAEHIRNELIETEKLCPRQDVPDARGIPLAAPRCRNAPRVEGVGNLAQDRGACSANLVADGGEDSVGRIAVSPVVR